MVCRKPQVVHMVKPGELAYFPALHATQPTLELEVLYVPFGHSTQAVPP